MIVESLSMYYWLLTRNYSCFVCVMVAPPTQIGSPTLKLELNHAVCLSLS
jgi:hypothetical protein